MCKQRICFQDDCTLLHEVRWGKLLALLLQCKYFPFNLFFKTLKICFLIKHALVGIPKNSTLICFQKIWNHFVMAEKFILISLAMWHLAKMYSFDALSHTDLFIQWTDHPEIIYREQYYLTEYMPLLYIKVLRALHSLILLFKQDGSLNTSQNHFCLFSLKLLGNRILLFPMMSPTHHCAE